LSEPSLGDILEQVTALDQTSTPGGISRVFVEVRDTGTREVSVRANAEGLIYLARRLLELAASTVPGKHVHIDTAGMADHCDRDLVLARWPAPWD
jgi:hypothetical protein